MSERKNIFITAGFVLAVSLLASSLAVLAAFYYCGRMQFHLLNHICSEILNQAPEMIGTVSAVLKEYIEENGKEGEEILAALGYETADFIDSLYREITFFVFGGVLIGILLFVFTFYYRNKEETKRIQDLADYLEQVNTGKPEILSVHREDRFSKLEDEIYKTVTFLYQTKEEAVQIKNSFAKNLSNIAHQIKTPITAISLCVQTMKNTGVKEYTERIQKQILRLSHLEEGLLVLARLDAGSLVFQKEKIDVFTVISLGAENLQELACRSGTSIVILEQGEMAIMADLDWTIEAIINVMKNCIEHNEGGTVYCSYKQNPIYTEICIWDEGEGFAKEDIPHLFERFYRGKNAGEGGIGIGLALAKEIIEQQNGTIRAKNMPKGGACFEIRFYSH